MSNKNKKVKACDFKCEICKSNHKAIINIGTSVGDGQDLAGNIAGGENKKKEYIKNHKLYSTLRKDKRQDSPIAELQAHHLICTEAMDDEGKAPKGGYTWEDLCNWFGYNINHKKNGVFLPSNMAVACAYKVPLHRGGHAATETDNTMINYVNAVKNEIQDLKRIKKEHYCNAPEKFVEKLNNISLKIFDKIIKFDWTLTADGKDYDSVRGCMNCTSIEDKWKKVLKGKGKGKLIRKIKEEASDNGQSESLALHKEASKLASINDYCTNKQHKNTQKYTLKISE